MSTDTVVRARIDSDTKARATEALQAMGLSVSDAIRLLLLRVADEKRLPFTVQTPNATTARAMKELTRGGESDSVPPRSCSGISTSEMLTPVRSTQFKRDVRRAKKRGRDLSRLRAVLASLIRQEPLTARSLDHPLRGIWKGYREAHIEPDWLLVYRVAGNELRLVRTGSHADLFKE